MGCRYVIDEGRGYDFLVMTVELVALLSFGSLALQSISSGEGCLNL